MARGRPTRSRPDEGEASSNHEATSPHDQTTMNTQTASSSCPVTCPTTMSQSQNEVVTQLLPPLMVVQEATERLAGNRTIQPPVFTLTPLVIEPVVDEAVQGVTVAKADNSSTAKRPATQPKELSLYLTKAKIEAMFQKGTRPAAIAPKNLDLKPSYSDKVAEKDFSTKYKVSKFQKFDGRKGNIKEHVARFLDSMVKYAKDQELCF